MTETRIARRPSEALGTGWGPLSRAFGDSFFRPFFMTDFFDRFDTTEPQTWVPAVDIRETDASYLVTADLPGFDKASVDITLENNTLTIAGERQWDDQSGLRVHRTERGYGRFLRSFTLPSHVESDAVKAKFKNGVLNIEVPKAEGARARRIQVN